MDFVCGCHDYFENPSFSKWNSAKLPFYSPKLKFRVCKSPPIEGNTRRDIIYLKGENLTRKHSSISFNGGVVLQQKYPPLETLFHHTSIEGPEAMLPCHIPYHQINALFSCVSFDAWRLLKTKFKFGLK